MFLFSDGPSMWLLLFIQGMFCVTASLFSLRLLPRWAGMLRRHRLVDERLKGAIGAENVSRYIQADEERGRALMDNISQKQEEVGRNLARRIGNTNEMLRRNNEVMDLLKASVADMSKRLSEMADPAELEKYRRETVRLKEENDNLRKRMDEAESSRLAVSREAAVSPAEEAAEESVPEHEDAKRKSGGDHPMSETFAMAEDDKPDVPETQPKPSEDAEPEAETVADEEPEFVGLAGKPEKEEMETIEKEMETEMLGSLDSDGQEFPEDIEDETDFDESGDVASYW